MQHWRRDTVQGYIGLYRGSGFCKLRKPNLGHLHLANILTIMSFFHRYRRALWSVGLLLAAFLCIVWIDFSGPPNPPKQEQNVVSEGREGKQSHLQASKLGTGGPPGSGSVSYFDKPRNLPKKIEIDNWLDRRGRSPRNLIAAAALGGAEDKRLILESLKNNPNDPATLMRVLQHNLLPQRTEELYESLRRNSPNNAMPYLLEAARLLAAGKSEAALAPLLSAAQRPEFDSYIKGIKGNAELMLRDMGRDELAAAALSSLVISDPVLEEIAFRLSTTESTKSTPLLIAAQISALEALSGNPTTVMGKYSSISHLYDLINQSKDNAAELGPYLDRPFNDYHESIWQQRLDASRYVKYTNDPGKMLAAFPVETQVDFFRRASKLGEVEAVDWLLSLDKTN